MKDCLHFVGFRGDEYLNAVRVFGKPDFFHYVWDRRAKREIAAGDLVVFARHDENTEPSKFSGADIFE